MGLDLSDSDEEKKDDEEEKKRKIKKPPKKAKKGAKSIASLNSNYKESSSDSDSLDMGKVRH